MHGIRTVKSLGAGAAARGSVGQRHRRRRQLEAGNARPRSQLAADPGQAAGNVHARGVLLVGALDGPDRRPRQAASLMAFMMLGGRLSPAARQRGPHDRGHRGHPQRCDHGRLRVMNEPQEDAQPGIGLRPRFERRDQLRQGRFQLSGHQDAARWRDELQHSRRQHASGWSGAPAPASPPSPGCCKASTATTRATSRSTATSCARST